MHAEWWSYLIIYCNVYLYVKILYKKPVALVYCVHLVYIYILGFGSVLQDFDTVIWDLYRIYHRWATQMGGNLWFRWGPRRSTNGLCSLRMTGPSRRCFCAWVAWVASVAGVALRQGTAIPIESIRILTSWWIEIEILNGWGGMLLQFDVLISLWVEFLHAQEQRFLPRIWDAMIALNITGKALLESFGTAGHDWGKILGSSSWSLFCCPVAGDPTCAHGIALATRVSRRHVRGHWTVSMRAARWGNPKTKKGAETSHWESKTVAYWRLRDATARLPWKGCGTRLLPTKSRPVGWSLWNNVKLIIRQLHAAFPNRFGNSKTCHCSWSTGLCVAMDRLNSSALESKHSGSLGCNMGKNMWKILEQPRTTSVQNGVLPRWSGVSWSLSFKRLKTRSATTRDVHVLFIWLALSLFARCCLHRLHIDTQPTCQKHGKTCRFEWVERGAALRSVAGVWREAGRGDLQNAPGDAALQRFAKLCNALLWCFDMFWLETFYVLSIVVYCCILLSCMSHMFYRCHVVLIWLLASIPAASFTQSWLWADQDAAKTSLSRFWRTNSRTRDSLNSNRKCPRFKNL